MDELIGFVGFCFVLFIVFFIGGCVGDASSNDLWHDRMIDAGCAQHNPRTGDWEWTGELCNPGVALKEAGDE